MNLRKKFRVLDKILSYTNRGKISTSLTSTVHNILNEFQ